MFHVVSFLTESTEDKNNGSLFLKSFTVSSSPRKTSVNYIPAG